MTIYPRQERHQPHNYEKIYKVLREWYTPLQIGEIWEYLRKFDIKLNKQEETDE